MTKEEEVPDLFAATRLKPGVNETVHSGNQYQPQGKMFTLIVDFIVLVRRKVVRENNSTKIGGS